MKKQTSDKILTAIGIITLSIILPPLGILYVVGYLYGLLMEDTEKRSRDILSTRYDTDGLILTEEEKKIKHMIERLKAQ